MLCKPYVRYLHTICTQTRGFGIISALAKDIILRNDCEPSYIQQREFILIFDVLKSEPLQLEETRKHQVSEL